LLWAEKDRSHFRAALPADSFLLRLLDLFGPHDRRLFLRHRTPVPLDVVVPHRNVMKQAAHRPRSVIPEALDPALEVVLLRELLEPRLDARLSRDSVGHLPGSPSNRTWASTPASCSTRPLACSVREESSR